MKTLFCVIINLIIISVNYAQETTITEVPTSMSVQVEGMAGYLKNDNASLNKSLIRAGLQSFTEDVLTKTLAVKISINKPFLHKMIFSFAVDKWSLNGQDQVKNYSSSLDVRVVEPSIGYIVLAKKDFHLYPYAGFCINNSSLTYSKLDTVAIQDIAEITNVTKKEGMIVFSNTAIDVGLCGERIFKSTTIDSCPRNVRFFSVAIRAGYMFKLNNTNNASYHHKDIPNGPNFGAGGPYVKLSFGFGVRLRKVKWS